MSDDPAAILVYRLVDTSIRWGFLIAALAFWLAIRPPKRAATRHALCTAVLLAGPILAVSPRWGDAAIPWPSPAAAAPAPALPTMPLREPPPPIVMPREPIVEPITEIEPVVAVEPPAPLPPEPIDWPKVAWRAAAGAWVAGTILMLVRLLLGAGSLARWSRRTVPPSADDLDLFEECRATLPTSRPVRLARHPGTTSPVVVGGLRPLILLPRAEAWDERPADQRRAALWHEIAHIRRYDDAWKLLQELVRVPSWHHPLVHWLLGRLDRERELLCDEAAVSLGDDPKGLARLLLELSRRPASRPVPTTSLPFLDRRTTAIRIERLLEDDMARSLSRPSLFRTLTVGPLALVAALGIGGLRVRLAEASEPPRQEPPPAAAGPQADAVTLQVVDSQERPIVGVVGLEATQGPAARQILADSEGRLTLAGPSSTHPSRYVICAPGFIPASVKVPFPSRLRESTTKYPLMESSPFSGKLVDERGQPIADATIRLTQIIVGESKDGHSGWSRLFPYQADWPVPGLSTTTDAEGGFTFPYAAKSTMTAVKLEIRTRDGRMMVPRPASTPPLYPVGFSWTVGSVAVSPETPARITAVNAARLEGKVTSQVPGVDLSQLRVRLRSSMERTTPLTEDLPSVPVAADGGFTIDGLNDSTLDLRVEGPGRERDWIAADARDIQPILGATTKAVLTLRTGIEVVGKVVERGTGRPASGVTFGASDPDLMFDDLAAWAATDADGRYRIRMEPGRRVFGVCIHSGWDRLPRMESKRFVTVPEGVAKFEAPTIEIPPYIPARVRVVDADHRPLAGLKVTMSVGRLAPARLPELPSTAAGEANFTVSFVSAAEGKSTFEAHLLKSAESWYVSGKTDTDGRLVIVEDSDRVPGDEPVKVWVDLPDGTKHESQFASAAGGVEVVLPPREGAVDVFHGMVVDPQNRPIAGAVGVETPLGPNARRVVTDVDGRFTLEKVDRNKPVRFVFSAPGYLPASPTIPFVDRPGDAKWVCKLQEAAPFSGRIVDAAGKPITGATVRLTQVAVIDSKDGRSGSCDLVPLQDNSPLPETTTTTDDDGSFVLPYASKSAATEVNLTIRTRDGRMMVPQPSAKPLTPRPGFPWTIESVPVSTTEKTQITVVPAARLTGKIVSQVSGVDLSQLRVKVRASQARFASLEDVPPSIPVTADGQFTFDGLSNTKVDLRVEGPGRHQDWIVDDARDVQPILSTTTEASLSLRPGVEVIGKVVERKTGRPLAGAAFVAQVADMQFFDQTVQVRTDVDGRYRLRLSPRRYVFGVDPRSHSLVPQVESKRFVTIPDGIATFAPPTIEATPQIVPRIRVVDADRRPVADASVMVRAGKPTPSVPSDVPDGSWTTTVASGDKIYSSVKFAITFLPSTADAKPRVDDLLLKGSESWTVSGKTDADGRLIVYSPWDTIPDDKPATVEVLLPNGKEHKFRIQPAGDGLVEVALPPREEHAMELKGVVLDPEGKPVAGATVVVEDAGNGPLPGHLRASLTTDDRGRYSWKVDPSVSLVCVLARAPGFVSAVGSDSWATNPRFNAETGRDFNVRLDRPGDFGGVLVDRDGRPMAGARIRATRAQFFQAAGDHGTAHRIRLPMPDDPQGPHAPGRLPVVATTAVDGSFHFSESLPNTETTLWLEITDGQGRPVTVRPARINTQGDPAPLNAAVFRPGDRPTLAAVPASWIEGRVSTDIPGLDLSQLSVEAVGREPRSDAFSVHPRGLNRVPVRADGRYRIGPVAPATVDLVLHGPDECKLWTYRAKDDLKPPVDGTLHVDLEAIEGVEVVGKVIDSMQGRGLPGAVVEARPGGRTVTTDLDGLYHLRLPEGEARIIVRALPVGFESIPAVGSEHKIVVPRGVERFEAPRIVTAKLTDLR